MTPAPRGGRSREQQRQRQHQPRRQRHRKDRGSGLGGHGDRERAGCILTAAAVVPEGDRPHRPRRSQRRQRYRVFDHGAGAGAVAEAYRPATGLVGRTRRQAARIAALLFQSRDGRAGRAGRDDRPGDDLNARNRAVRRGQRAAGRRVVVGVDADAEGRGCRHSRLGHKERQREHQGRNRAPEDRQLRVQALRQVGNAHRELPAAGGVGS